jgi:hypothetical protein
LLRPDTVPGAALAAPWHRDGEIAGWLSRSAWSLALVALWRRAAAPAEMLTVWIPDYFCNASLIALRRTGARLVFYPVTQESEPDYAACKELAKEQPPHVFVLVHYFGRPAAAAAAAEFCKTRGAWLIEDAAHVLRPVAGVGSHGDFILYSPHKHLPLPAGAVLVARPNGPSKFGPEGLARLGRPDGWPGLLLDLYRSPGFPAAGVRGGAVLWLVKRCLQKLGIGASGAPVATFAEAIPPGFHDTARLSAPALGGVARRLLPGMASGLGKVALQRQRHQMLWDVLAGGGRFAEAGVAAAVRPVQREWTPYLAAYRIDENHAERCWRMLADSGLPLTTWPDLPPEVSANRERHPAAWRLRHSAFYLPLHQSAALDRIVGRSGAAQQPAGSIEMIWDAASQEQWEHWQRRLGASSLLQSWPYGEAKSIQGWQPQRAVFYCGQEPLALVQVLQKKIGGIFTVLRINRGPAFLRPPTEDELSMVWDRIAALGNLARGRLLSVAPELEWSGRSLALLSRKGFRQFAPGVYESAWVSLAPDLDSLRRQLDAKWRNMLVASEKNGLTLEIAGDAASFDWMMMRYQELMREKDFIGPPVELLRALRAKQNENEQLLVLRALAGEKPVAGICIARHGAAATYLLGWNGEEGRRLKANQHLLWQALVYLKQAGILWFDLGGISEEDNPGVTAFKLGINGAPYALVGEYWKW